MPKTSILIANGHRARFIQHKRGHGGFVELAGFVYPPALLLPIIPLPIPTIRTSTIKQLPACFFPVARYKGCGQRAYKRSFFCFLYSGP